MYDSGNKVLFIATVFSHLATFHKPFMLLLKDKGYEIHAAASSSEGRMKEIQDLGIKCWDIPFARSPYRASNFKAFRELHYLLKSYHFNLIHLHTPVAAFLGRYLANKTGQGSILYTAHGFHFYKGAPLRNWLLYYLAERIAAKWTDGLITINPEDYEIAKTIAPKICKVFMVHGMGVDLKVFSPNTYKNHINAIKKSIGLPEDSKVLCTVGEINKNKNQIQVIKSLKYVMKYVPNIYYVVVGTGPEMDFLKRAIDELQLEERIFFLGFRYDVPLILTVADIFLMTSEREGLGLAAIESMAMGIPIVMTDTVGARTLIDHGKNGLIVPIHDPYETAKAVIRILKDKKLAANMQTANYVRVKDYCLEKILEEMTNIYKQFLSIID